jgi:hypothetical protein
MLDDIRAKAAAHNLTVVLGGPRAASLREAAMDVEGTLDDYLAAVGKLNIPVIFASPNTFDDDSFFIPADGDEDDAEDDDDRGVDLRKSTPAFMKFERYIDQISSVALFALHESYLIAFLQNERWHEEFLDLLEDAQDEIDSALEQRRERQTESRAAREREIGRKIQALRHDEAVRTQVLKHKVTIRALFQYVQERLFQDEDINDRLLKEQVTALRDAILSSRSD